MSDPGTVLGKGNVGAVIPAYFEAGHIADVARRVCLQLDHVLVVDDGSTDATESEARTSPAEVIRHEQNRGKGAAIKTGLSHMYQRPDLEYVMILDGDGQHLPEEIPAFLAEANRSRSPMIVGNRMVDLKEMPLVRKLTNRIMSAQISGVCGQKIPDTQCGFRMIRRDMIPILCECESSKYDFETEMLVSVSRRNQRIASVPVRTVYGDEKSKINPIQDTLRFWRLMRRLKKGA